MLHEFCNQNSLPCAIDEIFGAENCVATIAWQNKVSPANDAKYFSDDFDCLVCFAKEKADWKIKGLERTADQSSYYLIFPK